MIIFDRIILDTAFKEMETKANKNLCKLVLDKSEVFYKHKIFKIFQFFEKMHQFVGDALVTGTKI